MGNTSKGALKAVETRKERYGANFQAEIGRKGGKISQMNRRLTRQATKQETK